MRVHNLMAALVIVSGCASMRNFVYGPTPQPNLPNAPDQIDGHAAVTYPVPADDPRGEVELAVRRLTKLRVADGSHMRTAHVVVVRMIMHNRDDHIWSIDCGWLDAVIEGSRHEFPIRAETTAGTPLWNIVLRPGESSTADLYYELPANIAKPSISVDWVGFTAGGRLMRTSAALVPGEAPSPSSPQSSRM